MSRSHIAAACALVGLFTVYSGCTSAPVQSTEPRTLAQERTGTGDVDSSGNRESRTETYKLPITRNGRTVTRTAFRYWSGEWPSPVIDVNSNRQNGTTAIQAYSDLRDPAKAQRITCTIKNGVYHPWAGRGVSDTNRRRLDPSASIYYTVLASEDYNVVTATSLADGDESAAIAIPRGARIENVVYYGENYCGGTLVHNGRSTQLSAECGFFQENANFRRIGGASDGFVEQWLYLVCDEKDAAGKNVKAFVQDSALLSQQGVQEACHGGYGFVRRKKDCN